MTFKVLNKAISVVNRGYVDPTCPPAGAVLFAPSSPEEIHLRYRMAEAAVTARLSAADLMALGGKEEGRRQARADAQRWLEDYGPTERRTHVAKWPAA